MTELKMATKQVLIPADDVVFFLMAIVMTELKMATKQILIPADDVVIFLMAIVMTELKMVTKQVLIPVDDVVIVFCLRNQDIKKINKIQKIPQLGDFLVCF